MTKEIDVALDVQKKLLFRLIDKPREFEKLPKKGLLLPREKVIVPYKEVKTIGGFLILPKSYSIDLWGKR